MGEIYIYVHLFHRAVTEIRSECQLSGVSFEFDKDAGIIYHDFLIKFRAIYISLQPCRNYHTQGDVFMQGDAWAICYSWS